MKSIGIVQCGMLTKALSVMAGRTHGEAQLVGGKDGSASGGIAGAGGQLPIPAQRPGPRRSACGCENYRCSRARIKPPLPVSLGWS